MNEPQAPHLPEYLSLAEQAAWEQFDATYLRLLHVLQQEQRLHLPVTPTTIKLLDELMHAGHACKRLHQAAALALQQNAWGRKQ